MKRAASVVLFASACLLINPHAALAQSAIAGAVKDATGAVLPGVTVEASSPALIERVRTVTTDAAGLYRIIDLRPGIYTVTFTLPGPKFGLSWAITLDTAASRASEGSGTEHGPGGQIVLAGHAMMALRRTDPAPAPQAGA